MTDKFSKLEVIKSRVPVKSSHKFNITWTLDDLTIYDFDLPARELETEEEEAEEIIRRLRSPPKRKSKFDFEKEIFELMQKYIAEEIDKDILAKCQSQNPNTKTF